MTPNGNPDRGPCHTHRLPARTAPGETPGRCPACLRAPASRGPARHPAHHPALRGLVGVSRHRRGRPGRTGGVGRLRLTARGLGVRAVLVRRHAHRQLQRDLAVPDGPVRGAHGHRRVRTGGLLAGGRARRAHRRARARVGRPARLPRPVVQRRLGPYDLRARPRLRAGRVCAAGPGAAARRGRRVRGAGHHGVAGGRAVPGRRGGRFPARTGPGAGPRAPGAARRGRRADHAAVPFAGEQPMPAGRIWPPVVLGLAVTALARATGGSPGGAGRCTRPGPC